MDERGLSAVYLFRALCAVNTWYEKPCNLDRFISEIRKVFSFSRENQENWRYRVISSWSSTSAKGVSVCGFCSACMGVTQSSVQQFPCALSVGHMCRGCVAWHHTATRPAGCICSSGACPSMCAAVEAVSPATYCWYSCQGYAQVNTSRRRHNRGGVILCDSFYISDLRGGFNWWYLSWRWADWADEAGLYPCCR